MYVNEAPDKLGELTCSADLDVKITCIDDTCKFNISLSNKINSLHLGFVSNYFDYYVAFVEIRCLSHALAVIYTIHAHADKRESKLC